MLVNNLDAWKASKKVSPLIATIIVLFPIGTDNSDADCSVSFCITLLDKIVVYNEKKGPTVIN